MTRLFLSSELGRERVLPEGYYLGAQACQPAAKYDVALCVWPDIGASSSMDGIWPA